jgi:hypothetical protein
MAKSHQRRLVTFCGKKSGVSTSMKLKARLDVLFRKLIFEFFYLEIF